MLDASKINTPSHNRRLLLCQGVLNARLKNKCPTPLGDLLIGQGHLSELIDKTVEIASVSYGLEKLSAMHIGMLQDIATHLAFIATKQVHRETGQGSIRKGLPLPIGGGKTLLVKAFVRAIHELDLPISVVVAASEVKALCDILESLVDEHQIPRDKIGLLHTMNGRAPIPATPEHDLSDKQFLLCTHNMVRTGDDNLRRFYNYQGHARDILIYDESLLISDPWSVRIPRVRSTARYLESEALDRKELVPLSLFVNDCFSAMSVEPNGEDAVTVELPALSSYALDPDRAKRLCPRIMLKQVGSLLQANGKEVRVLKEANSACARFSLKVSEELNSVAVLDASHFIRLITQLGSNVEADQKYLYAAPFSYPHLTIKYFRYPSGRGSIEDECKKPLHERHLLRIIANYINALPRNEKVLVWTFKKREDPDAVDVPAKLEQGLRYYGVDMNRVTIQTHGQAKGSNAFKHVAYSIWYGVFYPAKDNVAADMLGQYNDLEAPIPELEKANIDEVLHEIYQEGGRTRVRDVLLGVGGRAEFLIPIAQYINEVMDALPSDAVYPGARLVHLADLDKPIPDAEFALVARGIITELDDVPDHIKFVSSKKLKPWVEARLSKDISTRIWRDATGSLSPGESIEADMLYDNGWQKHERSWVRITFETEENAE